MTRVIHYEGKLKTGEIVFLGWDQTLPSEEAFIESIKRTYPEVVALYRKEITCIWNKETAKP